MNDWRGGKRLLGAALMAVLSLCAAGCDPATQREIAAAISRAKPSITNLAASHDTRLVDNKMDYGITLSFTLTNTGEAGVIQVTPWLSCSEGEWSREQNLTVAAGETMNLTYFFQEPTINSTNVQYGVRTKP